METRNAQTNTHLMSKTGTGPVAQLQGTTAGGRGWEMMLLGEHEQMQW